MLEVREIPEKETARAAAAMLALRPRWQTPAALIDFIDNSLRPTGYRLIGAFEDEQGDALAVAGFREVHALAWATTCTSTTSPLSPGREGADVASD